MTVSLINLLTQGGCYWKWVRQSSPGHSIALENGTRFKVAIEGPQSHRFIEGTCKDGYFVVAEGKHFGQKFESASEAVNTIREPSSNAFLYTYFYVDGEWQLADALRRTPETMLDKDEEEALNIVLTDDIYAYASQLRTLSKVEALRQAATAISRNRSLLEEARRRREVAESMSKIILSGLQ